MADQGVAPPRVEPAFSAPRLWHLVAFYLVCLLGAGYAELLAIIPGTGISIWLPSGLLLGVLLANPRRTWLVWVAVASLSELTGNIIWFHNSLPVMLLLILGNAAEALVGAYLMGRFLSWPFRFDALRNVLGFVLLGAVIAPVVAATVGALTLVWSEGQQLQQAFWLFWIGDATGALIAAPAVEVVIDLWRRRAWPGIARWPEAAALIVGAILVAAASLSGQLPFGLIIIPLLLLAAVRFQFLGSVAGSTALTLLAAAFQVSRISPFVLVGSELESHVQLQLFLAISTFSTLVVAALARQNEETLARLVEANHDLERRVDERTDRIGLLMRELNHRSKNTLTLVQSIARHTRPPPSRAFLERFDDRIHALGALQTLLAENRWTGAPLERVIRDQLSYISDALDTRITVAGPAVLVTASAAQTIGLAIHELATNASKYGSLSNDSGRVAVAWTISGDRLLLSWTEAGGPAVERPEREGFGTTVIGTMAKSAPGTDVSIAYEPGGLRWRLEGPLTAFTA